MLTHDHTAAPAWLITSSLKLGAQQAILATLRTLRRAGFREAADALVREHAMVIRQAMERAR